MPAPQRPSLALSARRPNGRSAAAVGSAVATWLCFGCSLSGAAAWDAEHKTLEVLTRLEAAEVATDDWIGVECTVLCGGKRLAAAPTHLEVCWPEVDGARQQAWDVVGTAQPDNSLTAARWAPGPGTGQHRLQLERVGQANVRCRVDDAASVGEAQQLQVRPGRPQQCVVTLGRSRSVAGAWVSASCQVRDALGHAIDAPGTEVAGDLLVQPPVQQLSGGGLVATVATTHQLTCRCGMLTSSPVSLQVLAGAPLQWAAAAPAADALGASPAAAGEALALHDRYGNVARPEGWLAWSQAASEASAEQLGDDPAELDRLADGAYWVRPVDDGLVDLPARAWLKGPGGTALTLGDGAGAQDWQVVGDDQPLTLRVEDAAGLRQLSVVADDATPGAPLGAAQLRRQQDGSISAELSLADLGQHAGWVTWTWEAHNHRDTRRRGAQTWLLARRFAAKSGQQRQQAAITNLASCPPKAAAEPAMLPPGGRHEPPASLAFALVKGRSEGEQVMTVMSTQVADPSWSAAAPGPAQQAVEGWAQAACVDSPQLRVHDDLINELWWVLWHQGRSGPLAHLAGSSPADAGATSAAVERWQLTWLLPPVLRAVGQHDAAEVGGKLRLCPDSAQAPPAGDGDGDGCIVAAAHLPTVLHIDQHGALQVRPRAAATLVPLLDWHNPTAAAPTDQARQTLAGHRAAVEAAWLESLNSALTALPLGDLPAGAAVHRAQWAEYSAIALPPPLPSSADPIRAQSWPQSAPVRLEPLGER